MNKNQIQQLLDSDNARLRINKYCVLRRWQTEPLGEKADRLEAEITIPYNCLRMREIQAREPQAVMEEVATVLIREFIKAAELFSDAPGQLTTRPGW